MLHVLYWLITVQAIGWSVFPLAYYLFPRLKDRGYSVSKPLGILVVGYVSWILSQLHVLPSERSSMVVLLIGMLVLSVWCVWRRRYQFKEFLAKERKTIIASEAIFLLFFVGWALYRAYDPTINHTEQPMDFAFLNGSIQSSLGAPEDPWLRGESISYYYFGHWMMGVISQIAGVPSSIAYNLSLVLIPAMAAMGVFGLVYNMVRNDGGRWSSAIAGGILATVCLGIVSNLQGGLEFMRANDIGSHGFWTWVGIDGMDKSGLSLTTSWMPQEFWWWFRATRVISTVDGGQSIDYTIQEFPFFSFMLGDLHAHVMSIPFIILFLVFSWSFFKSPILGWRELNLWSYMYLIVMALVLGGLAFTNMWDLPTFSILLLGVIMLKVYRAQGCGAWAMIRGSLPIWLLVTSLAVLMFLPYYLTFRTEELGIGPVTLATTRPFHLAIIWALFLVAVTPFIIGTFSQTVVRSDWSKLIRLALLAGFLPYLVWVFLHLLAGGAASDIGGRLLHVLPFAILISLAVYSAFWLVRWGGSSGKSFAMILAALGLMLIMGPELLFVDDAFGPPNERMNTVFKLYYQAWIILAIASGFALFHWCSLMGTISGWWRSLNVLWSLVFVILMMGSLYYAPAALTSKSDSFTGDATLNGLEFLARVNMAEYEAIKFVDKEVGSGSGVLEAVGEWFDAGLISSSTGKPTVLNWPGHQIQWRGSHGDVVSRERDVTKIYQTDDFETAKTLLDRYDVEFVYVGPRERQMYGTVGLSKFTKFMDTVFSQDDVAIYRMMR